jgi:16S rRNA (cytosine1402-N4)-methyltransferase
VGFELLTDTNIMENRKIKLTLNQKKFEIFHRPVMVQEVIQLLAPKNGIFLDSTVGGGGHAEAILTVLENGLLLGMDLDQEALAYSQLRLNQYQNFRLFNCNFTEMEPIVREIQKEPYCKNLKIMGILFDLGVSLHQIQTPERGFSYDLEGPLDMRFGGSITRKAQDIIRRSSLPEIEKILRNFGEERFFKRIARNIWENRNRLTNTRDMNALIESSLRRMPRPVKRKSLQRTFQALRIATNCELSNLRKGLEIALQIIGEGGRIVVLSYHSLEDRIAKQTFREAAKQGELKILTKKPTRPSDEETQQNPAARSARLRAAIKIAGK